MLADRYDAFLFDLDGVLYRGGEPVTGAAIALRSLRAIGKRIAFVTNNSSRTPEQVAARLRDVGVLASPAEIETSALATAELLAGRGIRSAFVIGEEGILRALSDVGIDLAGDTGDGVDAVVVGWDRSVDYDKLARASLLVERGAILVATNADGSYPAPEGKLPGAGALLAVIVTTTGAVPEVVGKPFPPLLRAALARAGGGTPLVIGDRLDTDIAAAAALAWDSALVLTGISSRADLEAATVRPTYVLESLTELTAG